MSVGNPGGPYSAGSSAAIKALAARSQALNNLRQAKGYTQKANLLPRPGDTYGPPNPNYNGGPNGDDNMVLSTKPGAGINWAKIFASGKATPFDTSATAGANPDLSGLPNPTGSVPSVNPKYGDLFNSILQSAVGLYNTPDAAESAILNPNAILKGVAGSEINPNQVGNDAGLQYNAQIDQLNKNYGTTQNQNAQNLADIASWFGQAAATQKQGAAANAKDFAAQLAGSQDAASAFINALGGAASPAAAGISNAADIASAGLRGEGLANTTFDNNMKGLVGLDQAQSLRNEQTAGTNRLQTLMDNIAQAQGQKAGAVAQARDNAQQALFGQKSSLANLAANLQGNRFNELEGLRQQKLAELSGLSNTALGTALAGPQIQGADLNNQLAAGNVAARQLSNIGIAKQVAQLGGAGNADISQAQPGTRSQIQQQIQSRFLNPNGTLKMAPSAIPAMIASELSGVQGWANNPALRSFAQGLYRDIVTPNRVSAYNKSHGK